MKHLSTVLLAVILLCSVAFSSDAYLGNVMPAEESKVAPQTERLPVGESNHYLGAESRGIVEKEASTGKINVPDPNVILQGGDTVDDATVISALPYSDNGTTAGYTDNYDEVCPYSGSTSPDVVYSYTTDVDYMVDITLCNGSDYDTKLYLYENEVTPNNPFACNDDECPGYVSEILDLTLFGGNTYYIVIDGYGGDAGNYVIDITEVGPPPPPLECPPGGVEEGEPDCGLDYEDTYNGGCNSEPSVFQSIELYDIMCGTSGTFLFGGSNYRDTDWFEYTAVDNSQLTWTAVADFPVLIFIIDAGSGNCSDYTIISDASGAEGDTVSLSHVPVAGQTYWYWIGPSVFSGWDCPLLYVATLEGDEPPPEDGEDCESPIVLEEAFPYNDTGNTCDFTDDCDIPLSDNSDVIYEITITETRTLTVSLVGSSYDTKLAVYADDCCTGEGTEFAYNDDYDGLQSQITAEFTPGTYYIVVDGFGTACGDYILTITQEEGCFLECDEDMVEEGEPICEDEYEDHYNGGCNSEPPVFQEIGCEQTICGTSGTFLFGGSSYRDTDWFSLTLDQTEEITFSAVAEFPLLIFIIDAGSGNCNDYTIIDNATGEPCDTIEISTTLSPGEYWFWVGPSVFTGIECGATYFATVMGCEPTGIEEVELVPTKIDMLNNYPNPFNAQTNIAFSIKESGNVSIGIYDILGRTVDLIDLGYLVNNQIHSVNYDASKLSTGTYFYSLIIDGNKKVTRKFSLLK